MQIFLQQKYSEWSSPQKMTILPCLSKPIWLSFLCKIQKKKFCKMSKLLITKQLKWMMMRAVELQKKNHKSTRLQKCSAQAMWTTFLIFYSDSTALVSIYFHCKEKDGSNRFGTIEGWVNDDRIFIFGWTQGTHSGCRVQHGSAPVLGLHSAGPHGLCAAMVETSCGGRLVTTTRPEDDRERCQT